MEPAVGPAVSAIHRSPGRDSSFDDLAARFATLLGRPPGAYVQRQRLKRPAHLLESTTESVGRIATRVGYTAEAAFGEFPRTWRKSAESR